MRYPVTNTRRALRGEATILHYRLRHDPGVNQEEAASDLLADIFHFFVDPQTRERIVERARMNFESEVTEG